MLKIIAERQILFYIIGAVIVIGLITKTVAGISIKRLVRAGSNMGKSNHALMRLVRAKFEHACMVSDKVQNIGTFVEKYVYEYRVLGIRLHTWRQLEKTMIWLTLIFSIAGAGAAYAYGGLSGPVYQYAVVGLVGASCLFLLQILSDEKYQIMAAKMYMVDFLENTYAHRYVKANQKEIQVTVQKAEEYEDEVEEEEERQPERLKEPEPAKVIWQQKVNSNQGGSSPVGSSQGGLRAEKNEEDKTDMEKEAKIREILEEFLVSQ